MRPLAPILNLVTEIETLESFVSTQASSCGEGSQPASQPAIQPFIGAPESPP